MKKIFSLLLMMAMMFTVVPVGAFASEDVYFTGGHLYKQTNEFMDDNASTYLDVNGASSFSPKYTEQVTIKVGNIEANSLFIIGSSYEFGHEKVLSEGINIIDIEPSMIDALTYVNRMYEVELYNNYKFNTGLPKPILYANSGNMEVQLYWDDIETADTYSVYLQNDTGIYKKIAKDITDTFYTHTGLTNGKVYSFAITAHDTNGNITYVSKYSNEVSATPMGITKPLNLTATAGDAKVMLNWNEVTEADTYNVYRSLTSGGPYTSVATNVYGASYVDSPLTNGTTYYYVVTAVNENGESGYSNQASTTPQANDNSNRAILTIILNSGLVKEYDVSMSEVSTFMAWYESKSSLFYQFEKDYNLGNDVSRTDYVVHDMIELFEVREYKVSE
ncbi:fibronectin type III domain-containing protein [Longirhabdus pacifica]|uniref:fibronectin type III domain-containing protein n=1 Tax=Longirhabdus pacifica TaxID=2305227 RepID=UPI0010089E40|nr:hypothetical protein [Longirhabdus pacifica]